MEIRLGLLLEKKAKENPLINYKVINKSLIKFKENLLESKAQKVLNNKKNQKN